MANPKIKKQIKKAKNSGMSMIELARIKEVAKRETAKMEQVAMEKAFVLMLGIPLVLLKEDYWQKSFNKKGKKFINDCASLFDSIQEGIVTYEELVEQISECGIDIETEWLNVREDK